MAFLRIENYVNTALCHMSTEHTLRFSRTLLFLKDKAQNCMENIAIIMHVAKDAERHAIFMLI
jgi:hypothetical protein